ncbi:transposase [Candidatus Microgenomates bacterium]|nr:transposase [Candidatus Microgenomates bacterium]
MQRQIEQKQKNADYGIFHIYNRGTEKRDIFLDMYDFKRFYDGIREFNTTIPVDLRERIREKKKREGDTFANSGLARGERLVDVLCFCLMPNHYHLILKPLIKNGVTVFMRKLATGYSSYFNRRYERSGRLFQNVFKNKEIDSDESFLYVSAYQHINPIAAKLAKKPSDWLWSSYKHFIGVRNDDILLGVEKILSVTSLEYKKYVEGLIDENWFSNHKKNLLLETDDDYYLRR